MSDNLVLPSDTDPAPTSGQYQVNDGVQSPDSLVLPSDMDAPKPLSATDKVADVAGGLASGVAKGTAGALGMPGDVQQMSNSLWDRAALWMGHKAFDLTGYGPQAGTPDREAFDKTYLAMGQDPSATALPTSSDVLGAGEKFAGPLPEPKTTAGQYAQTVGEFLPGAAAGPESVAKKIALGAVVPGVTSEAAGQFAHNNAPNLEPYARAIGAVGGVGIGAAGAEAGRLAKVGAAKVGETFQPMTAAGQTQMAADRLGGATLDLDKTRAALENAGSGELVPNSQPTTFQLTGDMGLGDAEKTAETAHPVLFQQRRADQNAARVAAMTSIQPTGGAEDLAAGLRGYLSHLDDIEAGKVGAAQTAAQDAASGLGGQQSADFYGRQIQGAAQPQIDQATQGLQSALDRVGGATTTPKLAGAGMRGQLQAAADTARQQRNALYQAIDPEGTLNTVVTGPRQAANDLVSNLSPMAGKPKGEEAEILQQMQTMPDVMPFRDLQALDSRITGAMSQEMQAGGRTPVWGRLSQLKGSVQDAISNGVANQVAYERHGIATGQIAPENSIEARWIAERDAILANRAAETQSRAKTGTGYGASGSAGTSPVHGSARTESQNRRGFGNAEGPSGASSAPLAPNFDQAAADRLAVAKQAHAEYARTFKQGPAANILKTTGHVGQYQLTDAGVPNQVFQAGPKGGDTLRSYLGATETNPAAVGEARNYAAMSLRRAAQNPDGTINQGAYQRWLLKHQDAISTLPNGRRDFGAIGPAQAALERFSPFTQANAPSAIPEMFFHSGPSGADGVQNLRSLIGDHATTASLTDYAASRLRSAAMNPDGTLDPRKTASFLKAHEPALSALPGLADRFSTAARATDTLNQAAAARKAATDAFQRDAVGKVMGSTEPADITRMVGGVFGKTNAVSMMGDLAAKAKAAGPDAYQGLRKAVADHIVNNFMSNGEAATSGVNKISANAFQTFARKNAPVLHQVFTPEEVASLQNIAADITRANRSRDAINIPGQSPTAQLQHRVAPAAAHGDHGGSWLQSVFFASHGAKELGHAAEHIPLVGELLDKAIGHLAVPVAVGRHVINSMRASGLRHVDDLYRDALLNPSLARSLLKQVKATAHGPKPAAGLTTQLGRLAPFYAAPPAQQARAAGGSVMTPSVAAA